MSHKRTPRICNRVPRILPHMLHSQQENRSSRHERYIYDGATSHMAEPIHTHEMYTHPDTPGHAGIHMYYTQKKNTKNKKMSHVYTTKEDFVSAKEPRVTTFGCHTHTHVVGGWKPTHPWGSFHDLGLSRHGAFIRGSFSDSGL